MRNAELLKHQEDPSQVRPYSHARGWTSSSNTQQLPVIRFVRTGCLTMSLVAVLLTPVVLLLNSQQEKRKWLNRRKHRYLPCVFHIANISILYSIRGPMKLLVNSNVLLTVGIWHQKSMVVLNTSGFLLVVHPTAHWFRWVRPPRGGVKKYRSPTHKKNTSTKTETLSQIKAHNKMLQYD